MLFRSFTPYSYAYFIFILPHSIITVSVITALLPKISRLAHENQGEKVKSDLVDSLRHVAVATAPSTFLFIFFGTSIASLLYAGTSNADSRQIGLVLAAFAVGLIPFSTMPLLLRGFYAYEDTKTPVVINLVSTSVMILLAVVAENFINFQKVTMALAIILGISNFIGTVLCIALLQRRVGSFPKVKLILTHIKLLALSLVAIAPSYLLHLLVKKVVGETWISNGIALVIGGLLFLIIYVFGGKIARVEEITTLYRQIRTRTRR